MELALLIAQTCATAFLAGWMTTAVKDNLLHPSINRDFAAMVLRMDRMAEMFPEDYARMKHRRIANPKMLNVAYGLIVTGEVVATLALWVGVVWLGLALAGAADPETARSAALLGALTFSGVWSAFLIMGNHYGYWLCHEWAQNTHFSLVLWGTGTMILLALAP